MAKKFDSKEVMELLVRCHRRCCVCHRFCGVKIETHHIDNPEDGSITNAIPVCFDCHAEIGHYNNVNHKKGRKFQPDELRKHKEQWLDICEKLPGIFSCALRESDDGPLLALLHELEYNLYICDANTEIHVPVGEPTVDRAFVFTHFDTEHFHHAKTALGYFDKSTRTAVIYAYVAMRGANSKFDNAKPHGSEFSLEDYAESAQAPNIVPDVRAKIQLAYDSILTFLQIDSDSGT